MGQFKPMVKMVTTEPSVELKLAKGGHVQKMQMGGAMAAPSAPPAMPARGGPAMAAAPKKPSMAARRRAMMARPAGAAPAGPVGMAGRMMKDGGEALEKHASMPASKAHKGLKTGGVAMGQGGFKSGGSVKTTKVDTTSPDHSPAKTGDVKMGNAGGYKKGGAACYAKGGGVEGNVSTSSAGVTGTTTGGVKKANAGGFKKGGKINKKAEGGIIGLGEMNKSSPGSFTPSGGGGTAMGGLSNVRAGADTLSSSLGNIQSSLGSGFKKGGSAKKAYATGGLVNTGRPVAMPQGNKRPSPPVSINQLSGTYKKGGEVKMNGGGSAQKIPSEAALELQVQRNQKAFEDYEKTRAEEAKAERDFLPNLAKRAASSVKRLFAPSPAASAPGSVTKTEKSVTVTPAKKRGGAVTC